MGQVTLLLGTQRSVGSREVDALGRPDRLVFVERREKSLRALSWPQSRAESLPDDGEIAQVAYLPGIDLRCVIDLAPFFHRPDYPLGDIERLREQPRLAVRLDEAAATRKISR